ncbi:hypothetical protein [Vibrio chaetopteri]|uniref:Uncharacterized protein n=1 Tax=Vibrio chaetopteri TaxID=3016528 RepID=A0AAU8BR95_9VIBR
MIVLMQHELLTIVSLVISIVFGAFFSFVEPAHEKVSLSDHWSQQHLIGNHFVVPLHCHVLWHHIDKTGCAQGLMITPLSQYVRYQFKDSNLDFTEIDELSFRTQLLRVSRKAHLYWFGDPRDYFSKVVG